MFTDFEEIFNKSKDIDIELPKGILDYINKGLPNNLVYKHKCDGICIIESKDGTPLKINTKIKLPEIPKAISKKLKTIEDLFEYLYRTQKECEIIPDRDENIKIGDQNFKLKDFIKDLYRNQEYQKVYMSPPPFPEPIKINIESGNIKKVFHLKREPYESMDIVLLKTIEKKPIEFEFYIDKKNTIKFNINMDFENVKDVKKIVETLDFYKSFLNGDIKIEGIEVLGVKNNVIDIDTKNKMAFWNKVLDLERIFDTKFNAMQISYTDLYTVEELYSSFIQKVATKTDLIIESMDMDYFGENEKLNDFIGKNMSFKYDSSEIIGLGGIKLELFKLEKIFNYYVEDIIVIKTGQIKIIVRANDNSYVSKQYFLDKSDLENI